MATSEEAKENNSNNYETMATSEEAKENNSNTAATRRVAMLMSHVCPSCRLSTVCLSCVSDVSNSLLGVCYYPKNTIQQLMALSARKTDLIYNE